MSLRRTAPILALLLLAAASAPMASAQNDTVPSPHPDSEPVGPDESIEGGEQQSYGWAILVGTVAVAGLLAYVMRRQRPRH